jgi:hypothetical protein
MRRKTTTTLAIAGTALAAPAALAADPPVPEALRASVAGHETVHWQMRAERRENVGDSLTTRAVRVARRLADARGEEFSAAAERRRLRDHTVEGLRGRIRALRGDLRAAREAAAPSIASPVLEAIAACESGGDPTTNTGNGFYGKYQFTPETWASVGGTGNPAAAPEAEQDARAAALYAREGAAPWPVCGR